MRQGLERIIIHILCALIDPSLLCNVRATGMLYLTNMEKASAESPLSSPQGYDQVCLVAYIFASHDLLRS